VAGISFSEASTCGPQTAFEEIGARTTLRKPRIPQPDLRLSIPIRGIASGLPVTRGIRTAYVKPELAIGSMHSDQSGHDEDGFSFRPKTSLGRTSALEHELGQTTVLRSRFHGPSVHLSTVNCRARSSRLPLHTHR